jgi:sugar/nucleoside kinase (ribokinase family)
MITIEREIGGGSAANTSVGIAALGHSTTLIARAGGDHLGRVYAEQLRGCGVQLVDDPSEMDLETGRCVVLVSRDGERTMATYLGASQMYFGSAIDIGRLGACEALYLEGYLLDAEGATDGLVQLVKELHRRNVPVVFSLSDSFLVDRRRDEIDRLLESGVSHVIGNELEMREYTRLDRREDMVEQLCSRGLSGAITLGEFGALGLSDDEVVEVPAVDGVEVVDTTGAGDLFAAGYLVGLVEEMTLRQSLNLGVQAAAHVISHFGARPLQDLRGSLRP